MRGTGYRCGNGYTGEVYSENQEIGIGEAQSDRESRIFISSRKSDGDARLGRPPVAR